MAWRFGRWEWCGMSFALFIIIGFGTLLEFRTALRRTPMTDLGVFCCAAWATQTGGDLYAISDWHGWHYQYPPALAILFRPLAHPPPPGLPALEPGAVRTEANTPWGYEVLEHALKTPIPFPSPRSLRKVVFMLSGSVHASKIPVAQRELPFKVEVVGRPGESRGNVTFHGRQMNNTALLASADALVINGGYSAVSEAFALGKPVFVVPVPGHAEQFVNARLVQDLGLGFVATEASVLDQLLEMHARDQWLGLKPRPPAFEIEGAREASAAILYLVQGQQVGVLEPALRGA